MLLIKCAEVEEYRAQVLMESKRADASKGQTMVKIACLVEERFVAIHGRCRITSRKEGPAEQAQSIMSRDEYAPALAWLSVASTWVVIY